MNLVVIPFHDWKKCEREGFRTRDAHFMQEFDKHPLVDKMLVINRPLSLSEMIFMRRNRKPREGTVIFQKNDVSITQVTAKTYTLDILIREIVQPIRMKRWWTPYIFGQPKVAEAVKTALAYLEMDTSYALFVSAPLFVPLVSQLSPSVLAFDAQDNLLKHALYHDLPNLDTYYQYSLKHADILSANSKQTTEWFNQYRADAFHIPNGVDVEFFAPTHSYSMPTDMTDISTPVVGYAGKMQELFDVALMRRVAAEIPDVNFVFIGQELNPKWMASLWSYSNTYYLGDKPYAQLPQYLAAFDICIIPYAIERQHGGDPIKFYEYLAMGKPIVTTDIGGVGEFREYPQVCVTQTHDEFIQGLKSFVDRVRANSLIDGYPVPKTYYWRTKADILVKAMIEKQEM